MSYGAFWLSFVAYVQTFGGGAPPPFVGWYLCIWGVFTFYMWIASFLYNTALQLVFLTLWITFFPAGGRGLDGIAHPTHSRRLHGTRLCRLGGLSVRRGTYQR